MNKLCFVSKVGLLIYEIFPVRYNKKEKEEIDIYLGKNIKKYKKYTLFQVGSLGWMILRSC